MSDHSPVLIDFRFDSDLILHLILQSGGLTTCPGKINAAFKAYYSKLYTPGRIWTARTAITLEETSIRELNNGKTPGPDGRPSEFYKKFSTPIAPLLLDMFSHSLSMGTLPKTLTEASISVILKKDKNPAECSSKPTYITPKCKNTSKNTGEKIGNTSPVSNL